MHIAMHDALNAIHPKYDQYAYFGRSKGANPVAAAAKAAHDVLVAVYPAQRGTLDAERRDLARDGARRQRQDQGPLPSGVSPLTGGAWSV